MWCHVCSLSRLVHNWEYQDERRRERETRAGSSGEVAGLRRVSGGWMSRWDAVVTPDNTLTGSYGGSGDQSGLAHHAPAHWTRQRKVRPETSFWSLRHNLRDKIKIRRKTISRWEQGKTGQSFQLCHWYNSSFLSLISQTNRTRHSGLASPSHSIYLIGSPYFILRTSHISPSLIIYSQILLGTRDISEICPILPPAV